VPSVARAELYDQNPWPLVFDILTLRAYAATKRMVDQSKKMDDIDQDAPLLHEVWAVQKIVSDEARVARAEKFAGKRKAKALDR
jgi:hypothetical protein